jgi:hypothetical protein
MYNPFGTGFDVVDLTRAINRIPNMYGLTNELNLFGPEPVTTNQVVVEQLAGTLNLLPVLPVGSPGTVAKPDKRSLRSFVIGSIPHDDVVLPADVQGVRAFGSADATETIAAVMARKLARMRNKHAITLEYLRMGALKGVIQNADGSTIYDLFQEFGINKKSINFALGTPSTIVIDKTMEMKAWIEDHLLGETMRSILVLCSGTFFSALVRHANVEKAFTTYMVNNQNLQGDYRLGFTYGGSADTPVMFREYRGQASDASGTVRPFIPANTAIAFPLGTIDTFRTLFAPADFNETVNTPGLELYAKQVERKFNRGWDLHTQSNPLPICKRPELLVTLTVS